MATIKFTDTLEVTASHGRLAKAAQIYDDQQKSTQAALNQKFAAGLSKSDLLSAIPYEAPGSEYAYEVLKDKPVGTIFYNVNSSFAMSTAGNPNDVVDFPINSYFIIIATPKEGTDKTKYSEWIRPLSPSTIPGDILTRLEALEARLKV